MAETITIDDLAQELAGGLPLPKNRRYINMTLEEILGLQNDTELPPHVRAYELQQQRSFARHQLVQSHYRPRTPRHLLRWYPGGDSEGGFLGWGENLDEVISAATAALAARGLTAQALGQRLRNVLDRPDKLPTPASLERRLQNGKLTQAQFDERIAQLELWEAGKQTIEKHVTCGYQDCPFDGCPYSTKTCPHSNLEFTIVNQATGDGIMGPGLAWHLIEAHSFFEGQSSPYHLSPIQLMNVLFGSTS